MNFQKDPVLVVGDEKMTFSIAVCLLQAEHPVTLLTGNKARALSAVDMHVSDIGKKSVGVLELDDFEITEEISGNLNFRHAIIITPEDLQVKRSAILQLENKLPAEALIAINTESIPLSDIQENAISAERIIGANWVEPAHTTFFLEIISNDKNRQDFVNDFFSVAKLSWQKDPYILNKNTGIRSRMMSAMVREAFYLLENDYVSIEDVDRACRNDPGYYLPFSGHCRYMDLMGTYIYGKVMRDLNPELSKDTHIPDFFTDIIRQGGEGFTNQKGFYAYEGEEIEKRLEEFRKFSYEIRNIISRYPFKYLEEPSFKKKVIPDL